MVTHEITAWLIILGIVAIALGDKTIARRLVDVIANWFAGSDK